MKQQTTIVIGDPETALQIGSFLKEARVKQGLTQEEVARQLEMRPNQLSVAENNKKLLRFSTVLKYAQILKIAVILK
jgi:transcriptional regulator with XRE-family HTH domain